MHCPQMGLLSNSWSAAGNTGYGISTPFQTYVFKGIENTNPDDWEAGSQLSDLYRFGWPIVIILLTRREWIFNQIYRRSSTFGGIIDYYYYTKSVLHKPCMRGMRWPPINDLMES